MTNVPKCKTCGGDFHIYGQPNHIHPGSFKHWCPRRGYEVFHSDESGEYQSTLDASRAQSRANAERYRGT